MLSTSIKLYGTEALQVALQSPKQMSRVHNVLNLMAMRTHPMQYYMASRDDRTRRIFPSHRGFGMLSRVVVQVLIQDWYDFDLVNAQLAICATTWKIPKVKQFLRKQGRIWDELCNHLGWPYSAENKGPLKTFLYGLVFGAAFDNLPHHIDAAHSDHRMLATVEAEAFVKRLRQHELIGAIEKARERMLRKVKRDRGLWDCYGEFIGIPLKKDENGRTLPNRRSVLAQDAQAMEFYLVSAVFELAQTTDAFTIIHWAHDGFVVNIRDSKRTELWIERITTCIDTRAKDAGVVTRLELKRASSPLLTNQRSDVQAA